MRYLYFGIMLGLSLWNQVALGQDLSERFAELIYGEYRLNLVEFVASYVPTQTSIHLLVDTKQLEVPNTLLHDAINEVLGDDATWRPFANGNDLKHTNGSIRKLYRETALDLFETLRLQALWNGDFTGMVIKSRKDISSSSFEKVKKDDPKAKQFYDRYPRNTLDVLTEEEIQGVQNQVDEGIARGINLIKDAAHNGHEIGFSSLSAESRRLIQVNLHDVYVKIFVDRVGSKQWIRNFLNRAL